MSIQTQGADGAGTKTNGESLDLRDLHAANIARQAEWCPDQVPDLSFRGNELGGECGEAQNVIKKLERERQGWRGSRATKGDLADELADVVICADLCAVTADIDLGAAVRRKFNATSEKQGLSVFLPLPALASPRADSAERTAGEVQPLGRRESDAVMQILHALNDLAEPWLDGAMEAANTGEEKYERRDMLVFSALMRAHDSLLNIIRHHGPKDYFPRREAFVANPRLLTASRDHIGSLERQLTEATPAPATPPGVPDSLREALEFYADENNYRLNGALDPNSGNFQGEIKARAALALIAAQPAGQSEQPALRAVVEVYPDRTDTRLAFGDRIRPEPGVKAVEQAIAALTAEYEARGGCPVVGRHSAGQAKLCSYIECAALGKSSCEDCRGGQADDLPDSETAQTNLARIGAAMGLQSKPAGQAGDAGADVAEWKERLERAFYDAGGFHGQMVEYAARTALPVLLAAIKSAPNNTRTGAAETDEAQEARSLAVNLEQCSLFVDSAPLRRSMTDAAKFLRALASRPGAVEMERPDGAIHNGREHLRRLGLYGFTANDGHVLDHCEDYIGAQQCFEVMAAALAARPEAPSDAGWVSVPVEPTKAMTDAGYANSKGSGNIKGVYRAMLAARPLPTPPSDPAPSGQAEG